MWNGINWKKVLLVAPLWALECGVKKQSNISQILIKQYFERDKLHYCVNYINKVNLVFCHMQVVHNDLKID